MRVTGYLVEMHGLKYVKRYEVVHIGKPKKEICRSREFIGLLTKALNLPACNRLLSKEVHLPAASALTEKIHYYG